MGRQVQEPGEGRRGREGADVEWAVGDVRDLHADAVAKGRIIGLGSVEGVLNGRDHDLLLGCSDLVDADLRETDVADLSRKLEGAEFADLVFEGDGRVDAVEVAEVESFDAEAAEARFDGRAQVLGVAERAPDVRGRAGQANLGGQQKLGRVRVQGLVDQGLGGGRAVGVRGVDVRDAVCVDGLAQDAGCRGQVLRPALDIRAGQTHRAQAEAGDRFARDEEAHIGVEPKRDDDVSGRTRESARTR